MRLLFLQRCGWVCCGSLGQAGPGSVIPKDIVCIGCEGRGRPACSRLFPVSVLQASLTEVLGNSCAGKF